MPVFEFVDADDPTARTRAKSHVARKAHRERRLREIEQYQGGAPPSPSVVVRYPSRTSTSTSDAPRAPGVVVRHPSRTITTTPDAPQIDQPVKRQPTQELLQPAQTELPIVLTRDDTETESDEDVQTIGDLGELDTYASRIAARPRHAFWTAFWQLNPGDRNLLQWYLVVVPGLSFGIASTAPMHPMRDWIFPLVGDSSAVLNSSLLIGAVNNPGFFEGEKGASRVLIQKGKTISLINQALQEGPAGLKDDILYAVAATALSEDRLGNSASCRTHLDGLRHMIRIRGGVRSLRKNTALCAALVWAEVSVSNYAVPQLRSQNSSGTSKISTLAMLEARHEEQIFCQFLARLQLVQLNRRRSHDTFDTNSCSQTDFLFREGSSLLAMLGDFSRNSGVITPISKLNANNCQVMCLFYINFMLCEFYGFPQLTATYLARLATLVRRHSSPQTKVPRAGLFVWVIVHEIEQDDDEGGIRGETDRLEWLIRMIRVARRLSPESSQMLHRALIESLKSHESVDAGMRVSNDLGILASRVEMGSF